MRLPLCTLEQTFLHSCSVLFPMLFSWTDFQSDLWTESSFQLNTWFYHYHFFKISLSTNFTKKAMQVKGCKYQKCLNSTVWKSQKMFDYSTKGGGGERFGSNILPWSTIFPAHFWGFQCSLNTPVRHAETGFHLWILCLPGKHCTYLDAVHAVRLSDPATSCSGSRGQDPGFGLLLRQTANQQNCIIF